MSNDIAEFTRSRTTTRGYLGLNCITVVPVTDKLAGIDWDLLADISPVGTPAFRMQNSFAQMGTSEMTQTEPKVQASYTGGTLSKFSAAGHTALHAFNQEIQDEPIQIMPC